MSLKPYDEQKSGRSKHNGMTWKWIRSLNRKFTKQKMEDGYSFEKIMKNIKAGANEGKKKAEKTEKFQQTEEVAEILDECINPDGSINIGKMQERLDKIRKKLKR